MNVYIADQIARDHADTLMAEAAAARRVRGIRRGRRARRSTATRAAGDSAGRPARAGFPLSVPSLVIRPFQAYQSWLATGRL